MCLFIFRFESGRFPFYILLADLYFKITNKQNFLHIWAYQMNKNTNVVKPK